MSNRSTTKIEKQVRQLVSDLGLTLYEDEITTTVEYVINEETFQFIVETVDYETDQPKRGKALTDTWRDLLDRITTCEELKS
jgi:hypothetical protein